MLKTMSTAVILAFAGTAFAQSTPSMDNPSATPSPAPTVRPEAPSATPPQAPVVTPAPVTPPAAVGGLSRCENMIGTERETCMQQDRASTGSTSSGSTGAAGSSTSGTSTQPTAPIGSPSGTVR